jgi:DNA-binding response OmpR family regulator
MTENRASSPSQASPKAPPKLLIVDDDRELAAMLTEYLDREGFEVTTVADGVQGLAQLAGVAPDLLILDVMLPGMNGLDVLRRIRAERMRIPVLMLTARGDDVDRILGLELGADDYLAKPFNPRELAARIRAILRRAGQSPAQTHELLRVGDIELDMAQHRVTLRGQQIELTGAELRVLGELMRHVGRLVGREQLTEQALGRKLELSDRSIDTHISNLRRKLGIQEGQGLELRGVRGAGYVLIAPPGEGR